MKQVSDEIPLLILDRNRVQAEWLRSLPAEVRENLLRPREIGRLLDWAEEFISQGSTAALGEMEAEVYRLAVALEREVGQEASLRYLRDGFLRAVAPAVRVAPGCCEAVGRVLCRITDAAWRAHAEALERRLQQEQHRHFQHELMLAKRIQDRLLPKTIPQIPGFDIAGKVLQAAEVGGDYWSCKSYPEDDIVTLKLADVTGHGVAAATLVAGVKFISGGYYRGAKTAAQVMERTNHVLVQETPHEILVTMVYAWLYPRSREMSVVNAGHTPVLLYHQGAFRRIEPTGLALGMIETKYSEIRLALEPGDIFFTCSDGITEPSADVRLGEEWVREQVVTGAHLPAGELVERILREALNVYGTPQDDMSVLVVKRTE
jgi:serine phosphatase RsbU (regulator of sigma subunit)